MSGNKIGTATDVRLRSRLPLAIPVARLGGAGAAALLAGGFAGWLLWLASGLEGPPKGSEPVAIPMELASGPGAWPEAAESLLGDDVAPKVAPIMAAPIMAAPIMPAPPADAAEDPVAGLTARQGYFLDEDLHDASGTRETLITGAGVAEAAAPWRRNAVSVAESGDAPRIALVIDDLGLDRRNARRAIALPAPLTLALMTYAEGLPELAAAARSRGHELLVHLPMAPRDADHDPGPRALREGLAPEELARRLAWGLGRFEGFVGVNNHMGSGFTTWPPGMEQVMAEMKARGLLYLDSMTAPASVGVDLAARLRVPHARRDVFIDNDPQDRAAIRRQLARLEAHARRHGSAVGIGHPHDSTLEELARWIPEARRRGFRLVPISAVVRTETGLAVSPRTPARPG